MIQSDEILMAYSLDIYLIFADFLYYIFTSMKAASQQVGVSRFVDVKDRYGDWRVGYIIQANSNFVKIRMDGWESKYDEIIPIGSSKIKPFRTKVKGYTGQMKTSVIIREHMKFNSQDHLARQKQFDQFCGQISKSSEFQITQYLRGVHYIYIDFLFTIHFKSIEEVKYVYQYLEKHLQFTSNFLHQITKHTNLYETFNCQESSRRAYFHSHFEVFDAMNSILQSCARLKNFFKANQDKIQSVIGPLKTTNEFAIKILKSRNFWEIYKEAWKKIAEAIEIYSQKKTNHLDVGFMFSFIRTMMHSYYPLEKLMEGQDQKKNFTEYLTNIVKSAIQIIPLDHENQLDIQQLHKLQKQTLCRYSFITTLRNLVGKLEVAKLNVWKKLIETESFEKKLRGIHKIKCFWDEVNSDRQKRQMHMVFMEKRQFVEWMSAQNHGQKCIPGLLESIFGGCEHQEVIRKGCELLHSIYKGGGARLSDIETVWNSCRNKNEVIKKTLYFFIEKIIPDIKIAEKKHFVSLITSMGFQDQTDITFFYTILQLFVQEHEEDPATNQLLSFAFIRLVNDNCDQLKSKNSLKKISLDFQQEKFAKVLTMISLNSQHLKQYLCIIFKTIQKETTDYVKNMDEFLKQSAYQNEEMLILVKKCCVNFMLKLLLNIYNNIDNKQLGLEEDSMHIMVHKLVQSVKEMIKLPKNETQYSLKVMELLQKNCHYILKIIEFMEKQEFQFNEDDLKCICDVFFSDQEFCKELRTAILYHWLLRPTKNSYMPHVITYRINKCLSRPLTSIVLREYLLNSNLMDYINLSVSEYNVIYNFFLNVNIDQGFIKVITHKLSNWKYYQTRNFNSCFGLNQLWKIFSNARNPHVIEQVIKNLIQLYLSYQPNLEVDPHAKKHEGIQKLLVKLEKTMNDAKKRSNNRLVRFSLEFLKQTILTVKEDYSKIPSEFQMENKIYSLPKKLILVEYNDKITEIKVCYANQLCELLKIVSQLTELPTYHMNIYCQRYDDSLLSRSTGQTLPPRLQKIQKQFAYFPLFLVLPNTYSVKSKDHSALLKIKCEQNFKYQFLKQFFSSKFEQTILKILSSDISGPNNRECSELAYNILISIPTHKNKQQIFRQLLQQPSLTKGLLKQQSIYYRMYLIKILNAIITQSCQIGGDAYKSLLTKYTGIYQEILGHIKQIDISEKIEAELLFEIMRGVEKTFYFLSRNIKDSQKDNQIIHEIMKDLNLLSYLNVDDIIHCALKLLYFILQRSQQNVNHQKIRNNKNDRILIQLFMECFKVMQLLYGHKKYRLLDAIIETAHWSQLFGIIFTDNVYYFCREFTKHFSHLCEMLHSNKENSCLRVQNQEKLFSLIFENIYDEVSKMDKPLNQRIRTSAMLFDIMKDFIRILSDQKLDELTNSENSFYHRHCLGTIKSQSDNKLESENICFQGHLQLIYELITRKPNLINYELKNLILYECLVYDFSAKQDLDKVVKCRSPKSINKIITYQQQYRQEVLSSLLIAQQTTQLWRNPQGWSINIENEYKSRSGYVGLENPGCICYLNSLMQVLFMNKKFRQEIFKYELHPQKDKNQHTIPSILIALKKLFVGLKYSDLKQLSPIPFSKSLRTTNNKPLIKIYEQMDIEEFSSILFEKIERQLLKEEIIMDNRTFVNNQFDNNFIKKIFEGKYSNQIISQQCQHSSERQQHFISMQLDIKPSIDLALKSLISGEILDGQNKYYCERCDKKVRALKRLSIKKLPESLLICLKRFQYNFEYDTKIKINSYCQFKEEISFLPYTQQYLNKGQDEVLQPEPYEYQLEGVVIHTGSTENGHYYAYLEGDEFVDQTGNVKKWYEFNDGYVSQFQKSKLPEEAYGNKDETETKVKNAYMLVYRRKSKQPNNHDEQQDPAYSESTFELIKQVKKQNQQIHLMQLFFNKDYCKMIKNLVLSENYASQISQKTFELLFSYIINISMRQQSSTTYLELLFCFESAIWKLYDTFGSKMIFRILKQLSQVEVLLELFGESREREKSCSFVDFTENLMKGVLQKSKGQINGDSIKNLHKQVKIIFKYLSEIIKAILELCFSNGVSNQAMYLLKKILMICNEYKLPIYQVVSEFKFIEQVLFIIFNSSYKEEALITEKCTTLDRIWKEKVLPKFEDIQIEEEFQSGYRELNLKRPSMVNSHNQSYYQIIKNSSSSEIYRALRVLYEIRLSYIKQNSSTVIEENKFFTSENTEIFMLFEATSEEKLYSLVEQCMTAKCVRGMASFLMLFIANDFERTNKIINAIKKGLIALEAIKYRGFLLLIYYLAIMDDELNEERVYLIKAALEEAYKSNSKYFSQSDLIFQWIMKMTYASERFGRTLQQGQDRLFYFLETTIQKHVRPTSQLLKKQRVPSFERLNNGMHKIMVSHLPEDYEKLFRLKKRYIYQIKQETFPYDNRILEPSVTQDEQYENLPNKQIFFFNQGTWLPMMVKAQVYNQLRLCRYNNVESDNWAIWTSDDRIRLFENNQEEYKVEQSSSPESEMNDKSDSQEYSDASRR